MKTRILIFILAVSVLVTSCDQRESEPSPERQNQSSVTSSGNEPDTKPKPTRKPSFRELEKEKEELEKKAKEAEDLAERAKKDAEEARKAVEEASQRMSDAESGKKFYKTALVLLGSVVLLFIGWLFWPRKMALPPSSSINSSTRPKCPRCGWEHDPADTICKNPDCKTQF